MSTTGPKPLTGEQREAAKAWLREKVKSPCPHCGGESFGVGEYLVAPMQLHLVESGVESVAFGGKIYPCVPVVCANCANLQLYNAVAMGIVTSGNEPSKPEGNDKKAAGDG